MTVEHSQSPAFRSVYKVTMPNVKDIKDEKEKSAIADTIVNTTVMGINYSVAEPKISQDNSAVYFKVDKKNDANFENGFKNILDNCNKQCNIDVAKKVYCQKVDDNEYNQANVLQ